MQMLALLNAWEVILVSVVALVLFICGKAAGWDRTILKDRYALLIIGALVGAVFVVRALL